MNKADFIKLHKDLKVHLSKTIEDNVLPSSTDPTQDVPIRNIEVNELGDPLNVKKLKGVFSNLSADNFTAIERRNMDKFDVLGELQSESKKVAQEGVTTNFKITKKQKKHES